MTTAKLEYDQNSNKAIKKVVSRMYKIDFFGDNASEWNEKYTALIEEKIDGKVQEYHRLLKKAYERR